MNKPYKITDNDMLEIRHIMQDELATMLNDRVEGENYPIDNKELVHCVICALPRGIETDERTAYEKYIADFIHDSEDIERDLND